MTNPLAVVSTIMGIEPPPDQISAKEPAHVIDVELERGRHVVLEPADPRSAGFARVLDGLRTLRLPAYLEIDPATSAITRLLIPHATRVIGIRPITVGILSVELWPSHGQHLLRREEPGFVELEGRLRDAVGSGEPLIVTENDAHEIIDVRAYTPDPNAPPLPPLPKPELPRPRPLGRILELLRRLWIWRALWLWFRSVSEDRAQQAFDAVSATSCDPVTAPQPCIPFLYPDNGCWARAHEMCRLMIGSGLRPAKVWSQGALWVSTKNHPDCMVMWPWHVAPTLHVRGPGFLEVRDMVIDPSLFEEPVSTETWKGVQGDPNATLTATDASIYLRDSMTDPSYTQTNLVLAMYRLELLNRVTMSGPPPYSNCA
ncbi:protein-glutamine glutaminase family protein [Rhodococcus sp. NPDC058514]|uniref:protein-glutamine glutaminase family protein n=1 Tax=unclassified Rhodococcus (in: high G+C Gram-positive bacteria) TaxID=192944 RepID=UPI0036688B19